MQAQDYNGGLWSVGLRMAEPSKRAVEEAIADYRIIRTWPMRGTLHLVHRDDIRWLLALLAPRATASAASRRVRLLGLTDDIVADAERIMIGALRGGKSILRGDVVTLLQDVKGTRIDNQHTQHLMRNFGERGIICFGPNAGNQPTFMLLDEVVGAAPPVPRAQALVELARRYFISHGPATLGDFAGWGMLTMADARFGLAGAVDGLASVVVDGRQLYYDAELDLPEVCAGGSVRLLPGFDEYVLGYKDRSDIASAEDAKKIVPGNNGMFLSTVIYDGRVVGLWRKTVGANGVKFEYEWFTGSAYDTSVAEREYSKYLET